MKKLYFPSTVKLDKILTLCVPVTNVVFLSQKCFHCKQVLIASVDSYLEGTHAVFIYYIQVLNACTKRVTCMLSVPLGNLELYFELPAVDKESLGHGV